MVAAFSFVAGAIFLSCLVAVAHEIHIKRETKRLDEQRKDW